MHGAPDFGKDDLDGLHGSRVEVWKNVLEILRGLVAQCDRVVAAAVHRLEHVREGGRVGSEVCAVDLEQRVAGKDMVRLDVITTSSSRLTPWAAA